MDDQIGDSGAERGDALRRNNIAQAGDAAMPRQNFKQTDSDFDTVATGNAAEVRRAPTVAANADAKRCNAINRFSAQAHVGGNAIETERTAAIDRDRDFGGKFLRQRILRERKAQIGGERAGIDDVFRIEAGQRIDQNRDAVLGRDAESGDRRRKTRCRRCAQSANLDAAARGDSR